MAAACATELSSTVHSPPRLSATQPQNWRLAKARPSSIDSINAPVSGLIPTSVHSATKWAVGIAIGMQQKNGAMASRAIAVFGRKPSTGAPEVGPAAAAAAAVWLGGARRRQNSAT